MKLQIYIFSLAIIALMTGCNDQKSDIVVYDLMCEHLSEPYGIGTMVPGLSWKIRSDRNGTAQTSYQILAATRTDLLNEQSADLWNSGKVVSSSGVLVPYGGSALKSRSVCYWKVRIWDDKDHISEWSPVTTFTIGLLEKQTGMQPISDCQVKKTILSAPSSKRVSA